MHDQQDKSEIAEQNAKTGHTTVGTVEWRPIATAPKDGTRILLWTTTVGDEALTEYLDAVDDGCGEVTCAQIGRWDFGSDSDDSIWSRVAGWELSLIGVPSHWMPLPALPLMQGGRHV